MLVVLADDLTGAAAYGALLRAGGLRSTVLFEAQVPPGVDAAVYDLRTRDLSPSAAERVTRAFIADLQRDLAGRPARWAKRIDTTVRGHLSEELLALQDALQPRSGVLCPAYPEAGRHTKGGHQWVEGDPHGIPLASFLHGLPGVREVTTREPSALADGVWWIPDAQSPADLARVAQVARAAFEAGQALIVDAGPLMAALTVPPRAPRVLVVQGSTSDTVAGQVERLRWAGRPEVDVLYQPVHGPHDPGLRSLARAVRDRLRQGGVRGLVLGGGLTAESIVESLGARALHPLALPDPVVALCQLQGGPFDGLWLASKGGRIGGPNALVRLVDLILTLDHAQTLSPALAPPHPNPAIASQESTL